MVRVSFFGCVEGITLPLRTVESAHRIFPKEKGPGQGKNPCAIDMLTLKNAA
jgi:hypothetical protein